MLDPAGKFQNSLAEDYRGSPMSIYLSSASYQGTWFLPSDFLLSWIPRLTESLIFFSQDSYAAYSLMFTF